MGIALARISLRRKAFLRFALAAPVLLPPYIVGLAWTYLGSSTGWLSALPGRELLSAWTYSLPAAIVVLSLVFYPVSMLATEAAMRRIDGRLEEAALVVAPRGRVLRRITLPLAAPGVFAAALMIFVLVGLGIRCPRIAAGPRVHHRGLHGLRGTLRLQPRRLC